MADIIDFPSKRQMPPAVREWLSEYMRPIREQTEKGRELDRIFSDIVGRKVKTHLIDPDGAA